MREREGRGVKPWVGGLVAALGLALSGCSGARTFDLQWEEEVFLHDGRTIVVNVKYVYEHRGGFTLDRHDPSFFRETTLKFDAGPPRGIVEQRFVRQRPMLLDTSGGEWFVVLQGRAGGEVQDWGPAQNGNGQRTARLAAKSFVPTPIATLPPWMTSANLLMDYAPKKELAAFNGTRVTLVQKSLYLQKYPLGAIDRQIERPAGATT